MVSSKRRLVWQDIKELLSLFFSILLQLGGIVLLPDEKLRLELVLEGLGHVASVLLEEEEQQMRIEVRCNVLDRV